MLRHKQRDTEIDRPATGLETRTEANPTESDFNTNTRKGKMIYTTLDNVDGKPQTQLGVVLNKKIAGWDWGKPSLRDRDFDELEKQATAMGADAVVGLVCSVGSISERAVVVTYTGTAVKFGN